MKSALRAVAAAAVLGGASLGAQACADTPFLGQICTFAFNFCPTNFLPANGQELLIQQNTALFSLLGTQFGGNGTTTFKLPDLRGRAAVNQGQGPGLSPVLMGQVSGVETTTLTVNQLPNHTHAMGGSVTVNALTTETAGATGAPAAGANTIGKIGAGSPAYYAYNAAKAVPVPATLSGSIGATGGSQPVSVLDPRLGMNFCIAVNGIYPPRP
ncbi:phage tail protein [Azohydromonas sp. G-1-1-14]|uniref:Phage tail protein n=2 Tax=Azohydromonas caseinilytica TaxID=2728836 RepID=A0A848FK93_9BURK|nr:phage tail protein [Azohydromonas caseinilytica]